MSCKLYQLIVEDIVDYSGLDENTYQTAQNIVGTVEDYVTDILDECMTWNGEMTTVHELVVKFRKRMKEEKDNIV